MDSADSPLDDLRRQIDEIDTALHELLMRRSEIAVQIGMFKGNGGGDAAESPFLRPGREAVVLRRLIERHRGNLPKATIIRMWREMMSALVRLQGPFAVAVYAPDQVSGYWDLAHDHFGSLTPITMHDSSGQVLRAVIDGQATVGVLPLPQQDDGEPWWRYMLGNDARVPRVIARLPFGAPATLFGGAVEALAVGRVVQEETGKDRSLVVFEATTEVSRSGLRTALEAAALETVYIHVWRDPSNPDTWLHLIEIDGFLAPTDERLGAVARRLGESLRQIWPLGGYAVPFTPAELDLRT
jgi:chorismate mutase / prephenate dehydratase